MCGQGLCCIPFASFQVKPLLEVTGQEEKRAVIENEMAKYKDNFEKGKQEIEEMERKYAQIIEEKSILAEQLQAESEMCAEAEEVNIILSLSHKIECIHVRSILHTRYLLIEKREDCDWHYL